MNFELSVPEKIIFGKGSLARLGQLVSGFGNRALIVHGANPDRARSVEGLLAKSTTTLYPVRNEPSIEDITKGAEEAKAREVTFVIGIGGGSVIDAAKAISGLTTNTGDILEYLEVIGRGNPLTKAGLPSVAIPTTAGTGAEVTKNAVIASLEHQVKVSLRSPFLLPRIALVDPELTYSLPAHVTLATGLDALTQLIEPLVSSRANPATDGLCREGISRVARSLSAVVQNGKDFTAREEMALASLFGGLALANAGLGAVHGFAGPIGGMFNAPHGLICGILLPFVVDANIHALRLRAPDSMALGRYDEIGRLLTGSPDAVATDGLAWLTDVSTTLKVPTLSSLGIPKEAIPEIASKAAKASSMKANPIELTPPELEAILEAAW
ncbi:MAG TPA: iron-containing alcohol dehydrogenase [Chthoniobacterales bacterium]|nr:iron-containing alcohol dehydrogenase [Chthoniobacterales bacterium]